jgi:GNAT superfamily N-acetyltransferase
MAPSDPALEQISFLARGELDDAGALVREAGWNQTADDWRIFLELGTVYAVRSTAGRVIATAATLPYGGRFAWISMVLVAGEYRRRGLARRLMERCIRDLTDAGLVPVLDATPAGRMVYSAIGFEDAWIFQRLERKQAAAIPDALSSPSDVLIRPIDDGAFAEICRYDAEIFGADRSGVLARLRGRAPAAELAAWRGGRVCGMLLGRDGRTATQLGPLVAEDTTIAEALLGRAVAAVTGPIYIDLADAQADIRLWLAGLGFQVQRPFTRMPYRRAGGFEDAARTFAVAGPELG